MRLGTEDALKAALQELALSGRLNTAFIERVNLTVRHGVAALVRRTWAMAQQSPHLLAHLEWWRAYYHGCRVLTTHCQWRSCSRENEGATFWRTAIDNVRRRWQRAEPPDDGRLVRCSLAPCQRFPLERHPSQRWVQRHVTGRLVNLQAEELRWSLAQGREGLSELPHDKKLARREFEKGGSIYLPCPVGVPLPF
jgi:hypothetical protein